MLTFELLQTPWHLLESSKNRRAAEPVCESVLCRDGGESYLKTLSTFGTCILIAQVSLLVGE